MTRMKGGELIADYLVQEKVPYVFGICGHGNVGILDALHARRDKIQLISPRHEQCAGHMADAYFRVKHKPVATLTSTGPGSAAMAETRPRVVSACCTSTSSMHGCFHLSERSDRNSGELARRRLVCDRTVIWQGGESVI